MIKQLFLLFFTFFLASSAFAICTECNKQRDSFLRNRQELERVNAKIKAAPLTKRKRYQKSADFLENEDKRLRKELAECNEDKCKNKDQDDINILLEETSYSSETTTSTSTAVVTKEYTDTQVTVTEEEASIYNPPSLLAPAVIPLDDTDLHKIISEATRLINFCSGCSTFNCPKVDCAKAVNHLQKLVNLEQLLEDLIQGLSEAAADSGLHFISISSQNIITSTKVVHNLQVLAITEVTQEFADIMQLLVSLVGNLKGLGDLKNLKDPKKLKELIKGLKGIDSLTGTLKDALEGLSTAVKGLNGFESSKTTDAIDGLVDILGGGTSVGPDGSEMSGYDVKDNLRDLEDALTEIDPEQARLGALTFIARVLSYISHLQIKELKNHIKTLETDDKEEVKIVTKSAENLARIKQRLFAAKDALAATRKAIQSLTNCISSICGNYTIQRPVSIYAIDAKSDCYVLRKKAQEIKSPKNKKDLETLKKYFEGCSPVHVLKKLNKLLKVYDDFDPRFEIIEACPDDTGVHISSCEKCQGKADQLADAINNYTRLKNKMSYFRKSVSKRYEESLKVLKEDKFKRRTELTDCQILKCRKKKYTPYSPVNVPPLIGYQNTDFSCELAVTCPICQPTADILCKHKFTLFQANEDIRYVNRVLVPRQSLLKDTIAVLNRRLKTITKRTASLRNEIREALAGKVSKILLKGVLEIELAQQENLFRKTRAQLQVQEASLKNLQDTIKRRLEEDEKTIRKTTPIHNWAEESYVTCNATNKKPCKPILPPKPPITGQVSWIFLKAKVKDIVVVSGDDIADPEQVDPISSTGGGLFGEGTDPVATTTTDTSTDATALCANLVVASYSGNNNCGLGSTNLSISGSNIMMAPFTSGAGVNGATTFSSSSSSTNGTATNTNLSILGAGGHTCTVTCPTSTTFTVSCSAAGSCTESFVKI